MMQIFPLSPSTHFVKTSLLLCILGCGNLAYTEKGVAADSVVSTTATTTNTVSAPPPSPTPASMEASKATATTRQQIQNIVYDEDFSKRTQHKVWKEKQTATHKQTWLEKWLEKYSKNKDPSNLSKVSDNASTVGLFAKVVVLLLLLAGIFWVIKNADTWLAWFGGSRVRRMTSTPNPSVANHYREAFAPIWQGLPDKAHLSEFVQAAVAKGDWLLALSTLYRGTLREIVDIYDLPITRATTEHQSEWLLQKQTNAPHNAPQETPFFQQLIEMWLQVAYGQVRPNPAQPDQVADFSHTITALATTWDSLYLHRPSQLDKRYQQLEQTTLKPTTVKQKKFFKKGVTDGS